MSENADEAERALAGAGCERRRRLQVACCRRCSTTARPEPASASPRRSARTAPSSRRSPTPPTGPIPRQHLETVFEVCHFSHDEKRAFLALYGLAHPGRLDVVRKNVRMRKFEVAVPDLGSTEKNKAIEALVEEFARHLARTIEEVSVMLGGQI